jgi:hypothetical protein
LAAAAAGGVASDDATSRDRRYNEAMQAQWPAVVHIIDTAKRVRAQLTWYAREDPIEGRTLSNSTALGDMGANRHRIDDAVGAAEALVSMLEHGARATTESLQSPSGEVLAAGILGRTVRFEAREQFQDLFDDFGTVAAIVAVMLHLMHPAISMERTVEPDADAAGRALLHVVSPTELQAAITAPVDPGATQMPNEFHVRFTALDRYYPERGVLAERASARALEAYPAGGSEEEKKRLKADLSGNVSQVDAGAYKIVATNPLTRVPWDTDISALSRIIATRERERVATSAYAGFIERFGLDNYHAYAAMLAGADTLGTRMDDAMSTLVRANVKDKDCGRRDPMDHFRRLDLYQSVFVANSVTDAIVLARQKNEEEYEANKVLLGGALRYAIHLDTRIAEDKAI